MLILSKHSIRELRRQLHPQAILNVRMSGRFVPEDVILKILGFFLFYMSIYIVVAIVVALLGVDPLTAELHIVLQFEVFIGRFPHELDVGRIHTVASDTSCGSIQKCGSRPPPSSNRSRAKPSPNQTTVPSASSAAKTRLSERSPHQNPKRHRPTGEGHHRRRLRIYGQAHKETPHPARLAVP